ncbi:MAG TPA: hypothetical protein PKD55_18270 [Bellilinea sp.]|nr:hypothetical protein [Bellilinea sp.]
MKEQERGRVDQFIACGNYCDRWDARAGAQVPDVVHMPDQEILDRHNEIILAMESAVATYKHETVEVPPGSPQVSYSELCDQWSPRGDVLRCLIHDEGQRPVIEVDDREFTL